MMRTDHDLPAETEADIFDVIAKALLLRDGGATVFPFDELERAAATKCVLEKTNAGLVFRKDVDAKQ